MERIRTPPLVRGSAKAAEILATNDTSGCLTSCLRMGHRGTLRGVRTILHAHSDLVHCIVRLVVVDCITAVDNSTAVMLRYNIAMDNSIAVVL